MLIVPVCVLYGLCVRVYGLSLLMVCVCVVYGVFRFVYDLCVCIVRVMLCGLF